MAKPLTPEEKASSIDLIISLARRRSRLTVKDASNILSLHRSTVERYFHDAEKTGLVIRYGRLGLFKDQRVIIDFDLVRFSNNKVKKIPQLPPLTRSEVFRHVLAIRGALV